MKNIVLIFTLLVSIVVFSQENTENKKKGAVLVLGSKFVDYGTIKRGSDRVRTLVIKNEGDAPLIIKGVGSSCGCTVPTKPKKPIMPGKQDTIKIAYDTYRLGKISKSITIRSNSSTGSIKVVRIKGKVIKK